MSGLVVLDFGKLAYRPRRGGYGTVTFANRFASNRSVGWAAKAYARGYSECISKSSRASITLALGTSNYDQDVPSTYDGGTPVGEANSADRRVREDPSLRSRHRSRRRRRRACVGPWLPAHIRLLPRLRLRELRLPALQLRLARRRRRQDLEASAGLLRGRRHACCARGARDLQPRDGGRVGRAVEAQRRPLRQADQDRRIDDAAPRPLPALRLHGGAGAPGAQAGAREASEDEDAATRGGHEHRLAGAGVARRFAFARAALSAGPCSTPCRTTSRTARTASRRSGAARPARPSRR